MMKCPWVFLQYEVIYRMESPRFESSHVHLYLFEPGFLVCGKGSYSLLISYGGIGNI